MKRAILLQSVTQVVSVRLIISGFMVLVLAACQPSVVNAADYTRIYNPRGKALRSFHRALKRTTRGLGQVRILQYGASHTAADIFTGHLRHFFQSRFGDAGHGFVMPARPWRGYAHQDISIESSDGWLSERAYRKGTRKDGLYGLAGFSCASANSTDFASAQTARKSQYGRRVSRFDVLYLKQPGGGRMNVYIDGEHFTRISTQSRRIKSGFSSFPVPDGPHKIEIRPVGDGEVRLFGIVMERKRPGVVVDSLGIRGMRASVMLRWNEALWRDQIRRRNPNLVILAYGTNESGDTRQPIERYSERLKKVVARVRNAVPRASCLLVGPTDRPIKTRGGYVDRPRMSQIIRTQRRVASTYNCAFWDSRKAMGGPGGMVRWARMDPPLAARDHVHLTTRGYIRLAENLGKALLRGYQR